MLLSSCSTPRPSLLQRLSNLHRLDLGELGSRRPRAEIEPALIKQKHVRRQHRLQGVLGEPVQPNLLRRQDRRLPAAVHLVPLVLYRELCTYEMTLR